MSGASALRPSRLAAPLLAALCAAACGEAPPDAEAPPAWRPGGGRVLLVGVDGASPRVTDALLEAGRLPALAALAREGASGRLRSFTPLLSPRVWTSVATGKAPRQHGIKAFVRFDAEGGRHLYRSTDRRSHALWNILSERGLRSAVVHWWTTHPPDRIDGVMVTDHLFPETLADREEFLGAKLDPSDAPAVHPAAWAPRLLALAEREERLTGVANPFASEKGFPAWVDVGFLAGRFRFDETIARIALAVEADERPDLMMVLLPGVDKASHVLWGALETEVEFPPGMAIDADQRARMREALYAVYEQADALVARLVARYGPEDLVLVLSDHGFHEGFAMARISGLHKDERAAEAVLFARGPGIAPGAGTQGVTVNDVAPTVLAWLGLPVADDMDGRPAPFLDVPAPARLASYDTRPIERVGGATPEVEARLVEELEALGYLEDAGGLGEGGGRATE